MHTDLVELSVELGAAIDAVSGDIPGRKITTSLVGRLPSHQKYAYPQDPTHAISAIRRLDESSDSSTSQSNLERAQDIAVVGETVPMIFAGVLTGAASLAKWRCMD